LENLSWRQDQYTRLTTRAAAKAGGADNNAYTTNDLTKYHCQVPSEHLENGVLA